MSDDETMRPKLGHWYRFPFPTVLNFIWEFRRITACFCEFGSQNCTLVLSEAADSISIEVEHNGVNYGRCPDGFWLYLKLS